MLASLEPFGAALSALASHALPQTFFPPSSPCLRPCPTLSRSLARSFGLSNPLRRSYPHIPTSPVPPYPPTPELRFVRRGFRRRPYKSPATLCAFAIFFTLHHHPYPQPPYPQVDVYGPSQRQRLYSRLFLL
ncbi:hypothetical protein L1887_60836 [Cichorium endivia]|nr:hypothetical protein L1887_60836 [Cichorium endivia]